MDPLSSSHQKVPSAGSKEPDELSRDKQKIQSLETEVEQLRRQLAWFKREIFGQTSERREGDGNPKQLCLGEPFITCPSESSSQKSIEVNYTRKKSNKKNINNAVNDRGLRFTDDVEVQEIRLTVPELAGENAHQYKIISENITCRLASRPSSYVVLKYIQPVVKFIGERPIIHPDPSTLDQMSVQPLLFSPAMPSSVIEKSYADVSFIANAIIDKWVYHLPFHRQQQCLQQNGITLCSGYLVQLMQRVIPLLKPIYLALLDSVVDSAVLAMDEVPTKAGHQKKTKQSPSSRGKMMTGYYWPIYGDQAEVVFPFAPTRSGKVVTDLLKGFQGTLLSDGYSAYENFAKANETVVLAQCWAHSRRKFIDSEDLEPTRAGLAVDHIRALYTIEKHIRDKKLTGKAKWRYRQAQSKPRVNDFFRWIKSETERISLLPPDDYSKAIHYVMKRETELQVYLDNPDVQIDTNHIERTLRVIPMGKKNWLFNWTESGAEAAGIVQSLLVTCKLQGVNPYEYLVDVLQRIDRHPNAQVHELTPRHWKKFFSDNPLRSPLWDIDH